MPHRLALRCACGCEFNVPATTPIGALVPCPRCGHTLRIASVPTAVARPVGGGHGGGHHGEHHRPPSHFGPRKRLGVPTAPGHVSIRHGDSEVLVNYGLWTLLAGVVSTLTPLLPINNAKWDVFISFQPWAGVVVAASGVLMMIVYQSGPDFARGPGAPLLVAAFWMVGVTLGVFSGWIADRMRQHEDAAPYAAAPAVQQQPAPPPVQQALNNAPAAANTNAAAPPSTATEPPKSDSSTTGASAPMAPSPSGGNAFGVPPASDSAMSGKEKPDVNAKRGLADITADLKSPDKRTLLKALEEVQWYFQRSAREEVAAAVVAVLSHPEEDVQLAALKALKVWGDDADDAAVIPFASSESYALRAEAIPLLGKIRTAAALAVLVDRLEEDTELARAALIRAGKGCENVIRTKGLRSKSVAVRLESLKIVDTLGLKGALLQVRAMADNDKDGAVKSEARSVADKLAKKDEKKK